MGALRPGCEDVRIQAVPPAAGQAGGKEAPVALRRYGLCLVLLLASYGVAAQSTVRSTIDQAQVDTVVIERADALGLSVDEYERYQTLMQGPRGIWSPGMDPLLALGLHAETDAERTELAWRYAEQERIRVEGELAFMRAYETVWLERWGSEPLVDFARLGLPVPTDAPEPTGIERGDRIALLVTLDCPACDSMLETLLVRQASGSTPPIDLYLVDAETDAIQRWARERRLPAARVRDRELTLNHGNALAAELELSAPWPHALIRRGSGFVALPALDVITGRVFEQ